MQLEISTLRQESSRVKELENENENLRSQLDHAGKDPRQDITTSSTSKALNSGEASGVERTVLSPIGAGLNKHEHTNILEELEGLQYSYGKAVVANKILREQHRLDGDTLRLWKQYFRNWIRKFKSATPAARLDLVSALISGLNNRQNTGPATVALWSPTSSNPASKSSSALDVDLVTLSQHRDSKSGESSLSSKRATLPAGDIFDIPPDSEPDDLAETCENDFVPKLPLTDIRVDTAAEGVKSPTRSLDDDSDSPVFISERSLKRKRDAKPNNPAMQPGSTAPVKIKSDPNSSSPMVPISHLTLTGPQDSVDLDEVGEKRFTPRKRRRLLAEMRLRSSGDGLLEAAEYDNMQYCDINDQGAKTHDRILDDEKNGATDHLARDEAFFMKQGQEYGIKLWEQEQRAAARRRALNAQAPEYPRGRKIGMASKDHTHDQETRERQAEQKKLRSGTARAVYSRPDTTKITSNTTTSTLQASENGRQLLTSSTSNSSQQSPSSQQMLNKSDKEEKILPNILRPTDPNAPLLPRTSESLMDRKRTLPASRREPASARLHFLTEDGEDFSGTGSSKGGAKKTDFNKDRYKESKAPDSHQRLGTLLASYQKRASLSNNHMAGLTKPVTATAVTPTPVIRRTYGKDPVTPLNTAAGTSEVSISNAGKLTRPNSKSRTEARPTSSGLSRTKKPDEVLPEHEPLRIRPVNTLRPSDFKLSLAHNRGYDYPFSEVVRNRDLRKCMPGCTRPGCCGSTLRKVVEIGGFTAQTSGLLDSSPRDESEADQRLLEEYLGDSKPRLKGMPDQERNELLLKAKTERFANVHGKHRFEFGRALSPPGFWETDMPTTQQEQENRAAAMVLETERVAEMYKEAMRPNGRYKFRDE